MNEDFQWFSNIMLSQPAEAAWQNIIEWATDLAVSSKDSLALHHSTVAIDRVLAEAAWDLWRIFPGTRWRTSVALTEWWVSKGDTGRAVLIMDALSLREVRLLLQGAKDHGVPCRIRVTAAETPTDTDTFAASLGLSGRMSLANSSYPSTFSLVSKDLYTDVLESSFLDCVSDVKPTRDLFLWHTWLDNMIHAYKRSPGEIASATERELLGDGFWKFVNKMRQGRQLVITSDHGYAVSELFSTDEEDPTVKNILQRMFGASRYSQDKEPIPGSFLTPLAVTTERGHSIIGQRRWKVRGGYPDVCHGGLTILEALVPFIEFPEVCDAQDQ